MQAEMKALPSLVEANATMMMLRNAQREIEDLRSQLENETVLAGDHQRDEYRREDPSFAFRQKQVEPSQFTQGDAKLVLAEIVQILDLPDVEDPVPILETIRKLEKVVKAVPRMESFITSISRVLSPDHPSAQLALEQVIPRAGFLKALEHQYSMLLHHLLPFSPPDQTLETLLLNPEPLAIALSSQLQAREEQQQQARVLNYLMQVFAAADYKGLLESVNAKMLYYSDASTFVRQAR